jgi:malate dehydrogenase (oxaloacetate-decarboxylating)(NADP+)
VESRIEKLGLRLKIDQHFELCDPQDDPRYDEYWNLYHDLQARNGVSPDYARALVRTRTTVIAGLMVHRGEADAAIAGSVGRYQRHLRHALDTVGMRAGSNTVAALTVLVLDKGTYFIADTHVHRERDAAGIAEMTMLAAEEVRRFGIEPKIAMLSHSNFGSVESDSARMMQQAVSILQTEHPGLEVEGEMHADSALIQDIRDRFYPASRLEGGANLLIMPSLDAANISYNLVKVLGEGQPVGPILLGMAKPIHILTPSVTSRGIVNMSALSVVDAQAEVAETGRIR